MINIKDKFIQRYFRITFILNTTKYFSDFMERERNFTNKYVKLHRTRKDHSHCFIGIIVKLFPYTI